MGLDQLEEDEVYFRKEKMGTGLKNRSCTILGVSNQISINPQMEIVVLAGK